MGQVSETSWEKWYGNHLCGYIVWYSLGENSVMKLFALLVLPCLCISSPVPCSLFRPRPTIVDAA